LTLAWRAAAKQAATAAEARRKAEAERFAAEKQAVRLAEERQQAEKKRVLTEKAKTYRRSLYGTFERRKRKR